MSGLTASFLLNEPFKNDRKRPYSTINGTKQSENKETKLEFIESGVLKPQELPPSVIKLVPKNNQSKKASTSYINGFKHIFNKSDGYQLSTYLK